MKITIRKAILKDMKAVRDLVVELAVYEKEPDAVTATLQDYEADFSAGIFEVLLAESEDEVMGIALFYMSYSTWKGRMLYLEDFVVSNAHRRKGVGQLLFDAYVEEAQRQKARIVKWQVLDWNTPALAFYKKNKAIIEKNWWSCKIFLND